MVDTLIVVFEPTGDRISFEKAGQKQLAHLIVLNKSDEDKKDFWSIVKSSSHRLRNGFCPLVFRTNSINGEGIEELVRDGIYKHWEFLKSKKK